MICLSKPYHFKFFEGCLLQILLGHLDQYYDLWRNRPGNGMFVIFNLKSDFAINQSKKDYKIIIQNKVTRFSSHLESNVIIWN